MATVNVKIKKLNAEAKLPVYGSEQAAGADLYALTDHDIRIGPNETAIVHTGLAAEIPEGYVGLIYARSGLATKKGLAPANKVGVIDSDYRGEIRVALHNDSKYEQCVEPYDRVAHSVTIRKDTPLYAMLGKTQIGVNSYHHQAIRTLSPRFQAMATSEDGLTEAIYMPGRRFIVGVQWHPEFAFETDENCRTLIRAFVQSVA